jgi:hypothetical protein
MIDYKYAFVVNEINNNLYALVMTCWYNDIDGNRIDVKSDTQVNLSLADCFTLAQAFANPE